MANTPTHTVVGLRMPNSLRAKIAKEAALQHRTVSNLIVVLLLKEFGEDAKPHINGADHKAPKARATA